MLGWRTTISKAWTLLKRSYSTTIVDGVAAPISGIPLAGDAGEYLSLEPTELYDEMLVMALTDIEDQYTRGSLFTKQTESSLLSS